MKALLICPAARPGVAQLAREGSLATAPILGECTVHHWLERLAEMGARHVRILCPDRVEEMRAAVDDGARWGLQVEVLATGVEPTAAEAAAEYRRAGDTDWLPSPHDVVVMSHLPGYPGLPLFRSYASWFEALIAWMPHALTPTRVRVSEIRPGIWVSRRAHVSPKAQLIAPCWIGDQAIVESGAVIGPRAVLEDRVFVDHEARVTDSWVGPNTLVGAMTSIATSLAWGDQLTNWRTDSTLCITDPFLLSPLVDRPASAPARRSPTKSRAPLPVSTPFPGRFSANSDLAK